MLPISVTEGGLRQLASSFCYSASFSSGGVPHKLKISSGTG